jgi:hypothetical protein
MSRAELKAHNRSKFKEALLVGGCFALGALPASAATIFLAEARGSMRWLILTSMIAAFIAGTILWRKVFDHGRRPTFWRGAWVGALAVIVAHPLAWYLMFLLLYFAGDSSFPARTVHPLGALGSSITASAASLLVLGWITIPVGGLIGGGLGHTAGKEWEKPARLQ